MERAGVVAKREGARAAEDDDVADGGRVAQRRLERLAVAEAVVQLALGVDAARGQAARGRDAADQPPEQPRVLGLGEAMGGLGETTRSTKRTPRRSASAGATSLPPEPYDAEIVTTGMAGS